MKRAIYLLLLFVSLTWQAHAYGIYQSIPAKHGQLHVLTDADQVKPGDAFWVLLHLELSPQWYTYWENPGETGLPPTLNLQNPPEIEVSDLMFLPPQLIQIEDMVDYGYYNNAYFLVHVKIHPDLSHNVTLDFALNWVACHQLCVPESASFSLPIQIAKTTVTSEEASLIEPHLEAFQSISSVKAEIQPFNEGISINIPLSEGTTVSKPYLFVAQKGLIKSQSEQQWKALDNSLIFELPTQAVTSDRVSGYVRLNDSQTQRFTTASSEHALGLSKQPPLQFMMAVFLAFLGGLLLNIMPCVFPILTLKMLSLAKLKGKEKRQRIFHGVSYTLGILIAFFVLATAIILLQQGGMLVGWGFQMQSPLFLVFMTFVIFMVAMNLFGFVEFMIPLPIGQDQHPYSLKSSFIAGLLVTLIATPCTAPFMAPAMGYALTQPMLTIYSIFIALGIGLAFPYVLVSLLPVFVKLMPKPGAWMIRFKQLLAFPMLFTVVWLIWLLSKTSTPNFVSATLLGLVMIGFYAWFQHTYKNATRAAKSLVLLMTLSLMFLPLYLSYTPSASNSVTLFERSELDATLAEHGNVFVIVTADWCITCKVNESVVFEDKEIQAFFRDNGIEQFVIDWTKPNDAVAEYLNEFGRSGVPMYVFYPNKGNPIVLPQVMTKQKLIETLSKSL